MNWILVTTLLLGISMTTMGGERGSTERQHKVVFEFVSEGSEQMDGVLNNVENVRKALGSQTEVMVIAHGQGLGLVMSTNTAHSKRIENLLKERVVFAACENTLKKKKLTRADLLPGVTTVDSGVAEVVRRQEAGWSYVKSGH